MYSSGQWGTGEMGAKYHLTSHLSIFGEVRIDALSFTPNKLIETSVINNGVNITGTFSNNSLETDYVKSLPANSNSNNTQPYQELTTPLPASSWGFNIDVVYNFASWSK